MTANDDLVLTREDIARNPGVDPDVVREALRMRKELESMGVWVETGSRVVSPYAVRPEKTPATQSTPSTLTQW